MYRWIIFIVLLSFLSCNKDPKAPPAHQNFYSAKVNGIPFIFSEIIAEKPPNGGSDFYLAAKDAGARYIIFIIHDYKSAPISAPIDKAATKAQGSYAEGIVLAYLRMAISGNASINSVDKTTYANGEVVTGTFDFVTELGLASPIPYDITEGKFSVFIEK